MTLRRSHVSIGRAAAGRFFLGGMPALNMMKDRDRMRAKRVAEAMLNMVKLDIEGLRSAYEGRSA
jgi:hypothetical protein